MIGVGGDTPHPERPHQPDRDSWTFDDLAHTLVRKGKWFALSHAEVDMWLSGARAFDPSAHTGDRLMASWLAKEGMRKFYEGVAPKVELQVSVSAAQAERMFG